jgi:hypothetical protein
MQHCGRERIEALFRQLTDQERNRFPQLRGRLDAPDEQGVYVISDPEGDILHVGRTHRGQRGLRQRLDNHLRAQSSFVLKHLRGRGERLREGYTYQYLEVSDPRERALLEHFATAWLCPKHLGTGAEGERRG